MSLVCLANCVLIVSSHVLYSLANKWWWWWWWWICIISDYWVTFKVMHLLQVFTRKLSSLEDRGQTDRVRVGVRVLVWGWSWELAVDLDLWPWPWIAEELWSSPIFTQKVKVKSRWVRNLKLKTDARTDGRTVRTDAEIALPPVQTRSEKMHFFRRILRHLTQIQPM